MHTNQLNSALPHAKEYFRFMKDRSVPATDPSLTKAEDGCKIIQMTVMGHRSQPFIISR